MTDRPASTLEDLAARLREHEKKPDLLLRRVMILDEIVKALDDPPETLMQLLGEAIDARRKVLVGHAARPMAEVAPLIDAAVIVTVMAELGVRLSEAYEQVAKLTGVSEKKLTSFRRNLLSGNLAPDLVAAYQEHLIQQRPILCREL